MPERVDAAHVAEEAHPNVVDVVELDQHVTIAAVEAANTQNHAILK